MYKQIHQWEQSSYAMTDRQTCPRDYHNETLCNVFIGLTAIHSVTLGSVQRITVCNIKYERGREWVVKSNNGAHRCCIICVSGINIALEDALLCTILLVQLRTIKLNIFYSFLNNYNIFTAFIPCTIARDTSNNVRIQQVALLTKTYVFF